MQPVEEALEQVLKPGSRVTLIPSGLLSLLPLHAAWTEDESRPSQRHYTLDDFTFTYAPSAQALLQARQQAAVVSADSLLMIENPDGLLHFSAPAAEAALALFERKVHLPKGKATHQAVQEAFSAHNVLYFFTHGVARFDEPLQSGLTLADQPLTLNDIFGLNTGQARLAVLSACETGVPANLQLLDEVVSLPSGLMQAGVPGVVGSLWSVLEISTSILMTIFFELWRKQGLPPAEALRQAQIILREARFSRQQRGYFEDDLSEQIARFMSATEIADLFDKSLRLSDFDHPFYWAAFTYTGL